MNHLQLKELHDWYLIPNIDYGVNTIEKFHYNLNEISNNNKMSGYRVVGIVYGTDIEYVNIGKWKVESFFEIPTVSEINYITNNDGVPSIIEDFETTLADGSVFGEGTTTSQSSIGGKECMKIVTTTDGDKMAIRSTFFSKWRFGFNN